MVIEIRSFPTARATPVGVSDNVIEASWHALVDAIRLELMRLTEQDESIDKVVEDYCWGV